MSAVPVLATSVAKPLKPGGGGAASEAEVGAFDAALRNAIQAEQGPRPDPISAVSSGPARVQHPTRSDAAVPDADTAPTVDDGEVTESPTPQAVSETPSTAPAETGIDDGSEVGTIESDLSAAGQISVAFATLAPLPVPGVATANATEAGSQASISNARQAENGILAAGETVESGAPSAVDPGKAGKADVTPASPPEASPAQQEAAAAVIMAETTAEARGLSSAPMAAAAAASKRVAGADIPLPQGVVSLRASLGSRIERGVTGAASAQLAAQIAGQSAGQSADQADTLIEDASSSTPGLATPADAATATLDAALKIAAAPASTSVSTSGLTAALDDPLDAPPAPVIGATTPGQATAAGLETISGATGLAHAAVEATAQLAAQIARRLDGRSTRFEMALTPDDLGRVDVSLDIDADGGLTARLAFDNPLAATELRGRADELRRQLQEAGFTVNADALSFSEREAGSSGGGSDRRFGQEAGRAFAGAGRLKGEAELAAVPASWISHSQTPQGVDLKV